MRGLRVSVTSVYFSSEKDWRCSRADATQQEEARGGDKRHSTHMRSDTARDLGSLFVSEAGVVESGLEMILAALIRFSKNSNSIVVYPIACISINNVPE